MQGQEQGREGEEPPPWERCHSMLASSTCETTQGVMYFSGADLASFFITYNIQYSHPFETLHLFIKVKNNKRCINSQCSVTKLNCHLESVFQNLFLHPHYFTSALGSLAQFKRPEDCVEFRLFICICKNQLCESNRIFQFLE